MYSLRKRYGLSEVEYLALKARQKDLCAICFNALTNEALVDHNHNTGVVRGLLCRSCNFGIGLFCEDPQRLRRAAVYVAKRSQMSKRRKP